MTEINDQRNYDYSIFNRIYHELVGRGFDIDKITDKLGYPIEPKISSLVLVLNYRGYRTRQSCEGHSPSEWKERLKEDIDSGKYKLYRETEHSIIVKQRIPYTPFRTKSEFTDSPWVSIQNDKPKITRLAEIVQMHNQSSDVSWELVPFKKDIVDLIAVPTCSFIKMQKDIPRLAYEIAVN